MPRCCLHAQSSQFLTAAPTAARPALFQRRQESWRGRPGGMAVAASPRAHDLLRTMTRPVVVSGLTTSVNLDRLASFFATASDELTQMRAKCAALEAENAALKARALPPASTKPQVATDGSVAEPASGLFDAVIGLGQPLQAAVDALQPGATVLLKPGKHVGPLVLNKAVHIFGRGQAKIVVDSGGTDVGDDLSATVSCVESTADVATLDGVVIRRGAQGEGFGVVVTSGGLRLQGCDITNRTWDGVLVQGKDARPTLVKCVLHDNEYQGLQIGKGGDPLLVDCKIKDNKQAGILVQSGGRGRFERCESSDNECDGVHIKTGGDPLMTQCKIRDNKEAGVYVHANGRGRFDRCEAFGNKLSGVHITKGGDPLLTECKLKNNDQAGVYVLGTGAGSVTRCQISGNKNGGIVTADDCTAGPTLKDNAFSRANS